MSLREHVSLREHACVSSRGAQSTELVWILDFKQILLLLLLLLLLLILLFPNRVDSCDKMEFVMYSLLVYKTSTSIGDYISHYTAEDTNPFHTLPLFQINGSASCFHIIYT